MPFFQGFYRDARLASAAYAAARGPRSTRRAPDRCCDSRCEVAAKRVFWQRNSRAQLKHAHGNCRAFQRSRMRIAWITMIAHSGERSSPATAGISRRIGRNTGSHSVVSTDCSGE
jgi:hypothetical protein